MGISMINDILALTSEDVINGFHLSPEHDRYICNICLREFVIGEIFKIGNKYFDAVKTAEQHICEEHGSVLEVLTSADKRYTGITENQKELLLMIADGLSDNEIAKKTSTAAATVRHQRFMFKEKAKQAKLYLSIYELAIQGKKNSRTGRDGEEDLIDIHKGAKMVDDRYLVTKAEEDEIISNMFLSLAPLKLKNLSPKEKKKIVILRKISEQFSKDSTYSEKEVNKILSDIYEDFATVRRYLVEYGFMERTIDCGKYWVK